MSEIPDVITPAECAQHAAAALGAARRMADSNPAGARALAVVAVGWRDLGTTIAGCPAMASALEAE